MIDFGSIIITVFISTVIYTLLALVVRKGGCCGHAQNQHCERKKASCCNEPERD